VGVPDALDRELTSWIDSITTGATPIFTGADGRVAVAMVEAAYLSAELDRPVKIADL
jgi:predicted dehydrogenase